MTLLTRHASTYESKQIQLDEDGKVSLDYLLEFQLMWRLHASKEDVETIVAQEQASDREGEQGKIRFMADYDDVGNITRLGAAQGHSGRAFSQVDQSLVLEPATLSSVAEVMLHGTDAKNAASIRQYGLFPGGSAGQRKRAHVHMVTRIDGMREVAGVRGGTDALVQIYARSLMKAGAACFWSVNNVLLTEGLYEGDKLIGIPARFIGEITRRRDGEVIVPLPAPSVDDDGVPEGAVEMVSSMVVSQDQADQIQSRIQLTVADAAAVVESSSDGEHE